MRFLLILSACFSGLTVAAQGDTSFARVYFMRLPVINPKTTFDLVYNQPAVTVDNKMICRLEEKRYTVRNFRPGEHVFNMQVPIQKNHFNKVRPVTIDLEAGKTYYIQLYFLYNGRRDNSHCKELSEERAMMMMDDLKEDKSCRVDKRTGS